MKLVIIFCIIVGGLMIICLSEFNLLLGSIIKFEDWVEYILLLRLKNVA